MHRKIIKYCAIPLAKLTTAFGDNVVALSGCPFTRKISKVFRRHTQTTYPLLELFLKDTAKSTGSIEVAPTNHDSFG